MPKAKDDILEVREDGTIVIRAERRGKDTFIPKQPGTVVIDRKNKRRIGIDGKVIVRRFEHVKFDRKQYIAIEIGADYVVLKRIK